MIVIFFIEIGWLTLEETEKIQLFEENWRIVQMIGMFKVSKESEIFLKRIESFIDKFLFYDLKCPRRALVEIK